MYVRMNGPEIDFIGMESSELIKLLNSRHVKGYYSRKGKTDELESMGRMLSDVTGRNHFNVIFCLEGDQYNREQYLLAKGYEIPLSLRGIGKYELQFVPGRIDGRDEEIFYHPEHFKRGAKLVRTKIN